MPIYEYHCLECGHTKDVLQKLSDPLLTDCPACEKPSFSKKVSAPGFQLKGTGWYETDFKDKPANKADSDSSGASSNGTAAKPSKQTTAEKPVSTGSTASSD